MPADPPNLMQQVYNLFTSVYASKSGGTASLAFEIGKPVTTDMFTLAPPAAQPPAAGAPAPAGAKPALSAALGVQRTSEIADPVLRVVGNYADRSSFRTVSGIANLLIGQSMPGRAEDMDALGAAKVPAAEAFKNQALGSFDGLSQFHPVMATPRNWFDPDVAENWTPYSVGQATPPPRAPPPVPFRPPIWRVLPPNLHVMVRAPIAPAHPIFAHPVMAALPMLHPMLMMAPRVTVAPPAPLAHPMPTAPTVHPPAPTPAPAPHPMLMVSPALLAQATTRLNAASTAQAVDNTQMQLSFEYCIVRLAWPWFPQDLMLMRDWFMPGYGRGEFSSGTGAGDRGELPVLPDAFIVIRKLSISAKWSDSDLAAIHGAPSLDTFSLAGRSFDTATGTLSCAGMQVIGWFFEALPVLPPLPDPALAVAAPAATAATAATATTPPATTPTATPAPAPASTAPVPA